LAPEKVTRIRLAQMALNQTWFLDLMRQISVGFPAKLLFFNVLFGFSGYQMSQI